MKILTREIRASVMEFERLSIEEKILFGMAADVRLNAQAPYSHFFVGVAVMSESSKVYAGCNVERASWTQTTHAEQNAIDSMVSAEGPAKLWKLALIGGTENIRIGLPPKRTKHELTFDEVPVPCGHCLQCIWENCHGDGGVELFSLCNNGQIAKITIDNVFPLKFGPKDLGVNYGK
ncbi:MAG: hypothetical protein A3G51_03545 [Candidatus Yanofskybacteria bacterium RIFCSPLOWO2_12_FULL_43_11b]|uniref:CMP/dCMP-type deaminase domain-containing protein n=2 Tax=Parcubacteria group TaxID=1794811 RepID=A0A1G2RQX4_9BACT|nr:MAG: hypothetical protein A2742_02205 [Candidatus Yanofskybacteria bacterium RIFCSPHIGHO2_01_FULL_43_32]OGN11816.1 MAG: hypothetical protein A3C69_00445 [Candidatus Yanofskybacteria bacterium RIFCSPHIGHO2_02_FULL_43_12]OGN34432.1 MAG: hypothetical protein A3G51_03545 [Candidatus Yanofskybacteria bacterium RIFCSPLOWO2_12_FULL_43_11b]OHA74858.1 MAG: hypothetical protein A3A32_03345 [Candidatus Wildermuthbacteria bacterium RIFCSPLOWO2_01_FULL_48_35]